MRYFVTICLLATISCTGVNKQDRNSLIAEIENTEAAFSKMAADSGIAKAFIFFADDSAVLFRANTLYKGIENITTLVNQQPNKGVTLEWSPDFIDVASSGDLGYTYGKFIFSVTDSTGTTSTEGMFHTVWKKQADGSWKYVWD